MLSPWRTRNVRFIQAGTTSMQPWNKLLSWHQEWEVFCMSQREKRDLVMGRWTSTGEKETSAPAFRESIIYWKVNTSRTIIVLVNLSEKPNQQCAQWTPETKSVPITVKSQFNQRFPASDALTVSNIWNNKTSCKRERIQRILGVFVKKFALYKYSLHNWVPQNTGQKMRWHVTLTKLPRGPSIAESQNWKGPPAKDFLKCILWNVSRYFT